jgi:drug/metabolite transporter (DMT)-like permease
MTSTAVSSRPAERGTSATPVLLFGLIVLIWGSTWIGIKLELGTVNAAVSVAYRFLLAAVIMLLWAGVRRLPMRFPRSAHLRFALTGLLQYSVNYVLFYYSSEHLVSGLVSIVFATSVAFNILNSYLFLKRPVSVRVACAAVAGLLGLVLVFSDQIHTGSGDVLAGMLLGLGGTVSFSLGNIVSAKSQQAGLPVVQSTAWSMLYGGVFTTVGCLAAGCHFEIQTSARYLLGLFYLAVFGSAVAFVAYLTMLRRIGPERAGYATVVFPLVSLTISTIFESYHWTVLPVLGVLVVLAANGVILFRPGARRAGPPGDPASRATAPTPPPETTNGGAVPEPPRG